MKNERKENAIRVYGPFEAVEDRNNFFESMARTPFRLFGEFLSNPYSVPEVDIIDNGDAYTIKADIPGVEKKDIKIKVLGNRLIIRAEKSEEKEQKKRGYYTRERSAVGYYRSIALPEEVKPETAKAKLNNGTLNIEIEKSEAAKGHDIEVE